MELDRIVQSDALTWLRTLPDASVDAVITDIPYNEINDNDRLHERAKYANGPIRVLHKGLADVLSIPLTDVLAEFDRVATQWVYVFCGTAQAGVIRSYFGDRDCMTRHCVWEKTNPSPLHGQYIWTSSTENCIVARKRGGYFSQFCRSSVWRFPSGSSKQHPTEKPLRLMEHLILSCTQEGGVVCDPFAGSGTTLVAARNLERHYIGSEINADYVRLANERLAKPWQPALPMFA